MKVTFTFDKAAVERRGRTLEDVLALAGKMRGAV